MKASLTNGIDYIVLIFNRKFNQDKDECNNVSVQIKIGNLSFFYEEEFQLEDFVDFHTQILQDRQKSNSLNGIGFSLIITPIGSLGNYLATIKVDNYDNKVMIEGEMIVSISDIDRFILEIQNVLSQNLSKNE